jgi:hypothetical protein
MKSERSVLLQYKQTLQAGFMWAAAIALIPALD